MSFNPYAAGKKRYRGAGTAPNLGRTLDPMGYIERSNTAQKAKDMQRQQFPNQFNPASSPPSQQRSGLAQGAIKRNRQQQGQSVVPSGNQSGQPQTQGIPSPPVFTEPNPTWNISGASPNTMASTDQNPIPGGYAFTREDLEGNTWGFGGRYVPPPQMQPQPQPQPQAMPAPVQPVMQQVPQQQLMSNPTSQFEAESAGLNFTPPQNEFMSVPKTIPDWLQALLDSQEERDADPIPHTTLNQIVSGPLQMDPRAPKVKFGKTPKFKGGSATLDRDLRSERASGYTNLTDALVQLSNTLRDAESEYLTDVQQQQRETSEVFKNLINNFASRGMAGSSAYGQEYITGTEEATHARNELDQWLGRAQRDVLQNRSTAIQRFQNLVNELVGEQASRDAEKRVTDLLKRAGGSNGSGGGSGSGSRKVRLFASSVPGLTPEVYERDYANQKNVKGWQ